jgi:hypothetical protein
MGSRQIMNWQRVYPRRAVTPLRILACSHLLSECGRLAVWKTKDQGVVFRSWEASLNRVFLSLKDKCGQPPLWDDRIRLRMRARLGIRARYELMELSGSRKFSTVRKCICVGKSNTRRDGVTFNATLSLAHPDKFSGLGRSACSASAMMREFSKKTPTHWRAKVVRE